MMKKITLKLTNKQKENIQDKSRYLNIEGSAGSGKTQYACNKVILYCLKYAKAKAYVFRQTLKANKKTSWKEINDILIENKIPHKPNKSEYEITFPNGSIITFMGLDEVTKIRSLNADIIYVEQAEETSKKSFNELRSRIRSKVSAKYYGQIIIVTTPEDEDHWIYEHFHQKGKGKVIHFHYKDNPFLPPEYVEYLESLKEEDIEVYNQLTEGLWGKLTDVIFNKWDKILSNKGYSYYTAGVDFGFNNPSCFLPTGWLDGEPHVFDEVYQSKLTNSQFIDTVIEMLKEHGLKPKDFDTVYCDPSRPDLIQEFCDAGFNAVPADNSVQAGLDTVKRVLTHVSEDCVNFLKEIKRYKYRQDKDGNATEEPIKVLDHSMDAHRYNVYGELGALNQTLKGTVDYGFINQLNEW